MERPTDWESLAREALDEVVRVALGLELREGSQRVVDRGAVLEMRGEQLLCVSLLSDAEGCQTLGKRLFGLGPSDDNLPAADLADAICEMVNVIAGGIKRRLGAHANMALGLPAFVVELPQADGEARVLTVDVTVASAPLSLRLSNSPLDAVEISSDALGRASASAGLQEVPT